MAEVDGEVIGQALLVAHDRASARLERMYIVDSNQRGGVGARLLEGALRVAPSLGYRRNTIGRP
jgi:hypothetical protein